MILLRLVIDRLETLKRWKLEEELTSISQHYGSRDLELDPRILQLLPMKYDDSLYWLANWMKINELSYEILRETSSDFEEWKEMLVVTKPSFGVKHLLRFVYEAFAIDNHNKAINELKHEMEAAKVRQLSTDAPTGSVIDSLVETAPIFLFVLLALPELDTKKAKALATILLDQYLDENDLKEAAKSDDEWNDLREVFAERQGLIPTFDNLRQFFTQ